MSIATRTIDLNSFGHPTGKRRKLEFIELEKFAPGAIINVKVHNFVTYATTEFTLSPSLNMIIGPNGTGKSTFVCAVCLGLGGSPTLLGRQKVVGEFIKNGEDNATIIITLKNKDGKPNLVVKREMFKETDKSDWYLNDKPISERKVKAALSELNIQLDNLCQFLPQEKVADFAKLSPEKLLIETQRAIDKDSLVNHEKLIELDSKRIILSSSLASKENQLHSLESQRENHEAAAKRYEQYESKMAELEKHEKILPWAHLNDLKSLVDELTKERQQWQQRLDELNNNPLQLDTAIEKLTLEVENYRNLFRDMNAENNRNWESVETSRAHLENLDKQKGKIIGRMESYTTGLVELKNKLERLRQVRIETQETLDKYPEYDVAMAKELEDIIDGIYEERSELKQKIDEQNVILKQLDFEIKSNERDLENLIRELKTQDRISVLDEPKDYRSNNNNNNNNNSNRYHSNGNSAKQNARAAVIELRTNLKQFRGSIFEPPVVTVTTTEDIYAVYLDRIVDSMTQLSITAINREEYKRFFDIIIDQKKLNVPSRYLSGKKLQGEFSREKLQQFGFECYLVDVLQGPEPVIQMLREQCFIHDIPVSKKPLSPEQIEKLTKPINGRVPFRKFFSGNDLISISMSRYGSKQVIVKNQTIKKRSILFSTGGLSNERKLQISNRRKEIETMKAGKVEKRAKIEEFVAKLKFDYRELSEKFDQKSKQKMQINDVKKKRDSCMTRIATTERSIAEYEERLSADNTTEILKNKLKLKRVAEQRVAAVADVAAKVANYNSDAKQISLLEAKIVVTTDKIVSFQRLNKGVEDQRIEIENKIQELKRQIKQKKIDGGAKEWQRQTKSHDAEELEILRDLSNSYAENGYLTVSHIEGMIEGFQAELSLLGNSDKSSIGELKKLNTRIQGLHDEIPILQQELKELKHNIQQIRESWEPNLQSIVDQISQKFGAIFPSVGSAGEVQLTRAEKFEDWKLEILVAFREESELKALNSHTQSGGERAVSTVYFMISLQNLTNSPFRVVDEINQGMDARNERIVHKNMVQVACQENTSQYFLITPKLLTDLYYHPKMRVHCILAGPWIPNPLKDSNYLSLGSTSSFH